MLAVGKEYVADFKHTMAGSFGDVENEINLQARLFTSYSFAKLRCIYLGDNDGYNTNR